MLFASDPHGGMLNTTGLLDIHALLNVKIG